VEVAARLQGDVDVLRLQQLEDLLYIVLVHSRLAAGERDAPAGIVVVALVPQEVLG
jgi:hypothetical protein